MKLKHALVCLLFVIPSISFAWSVPQEQVEIVQQAVIEATERYGADRGVALAIVESESRYHCDAIGDHGTSFGCAQIHLPAHPTVSKAEAFDIYFMADFLAYNLSIGNCFWWSTCPLSRLIHPMVDS